MNDSIYFPQNFILFNLNFGVLSIDNFEFGSHFIISTLFNVNGGAIRIRNATFDNLQSGFDLLSISSGGAVFLNCLITNSDYTVIFNLTGSDVYFEVRNLTFVNDFCSNAFKFNEMNSSTIFLDSLNFLANQMDIYVYFTLCQNSQINFENFFLFQNSSSISILKIF